MDEMNMNATINEETTPVVTEGNSESTETNGSAIGTFIILGTLAAVGYGIGKGIEWGVKKAKPAVKKLFKKKDKKQVVEAEVVTEEVLIEEE